MLAISLSSPDDPIPGRKAIYTHIVPISDLSKFLSKRYPKENTPGKYAYMYKVYISSE